jgi:hypothetical protein
MKHHNKVPQARSTTQLGVRINRELWNKCQKLVIDLGIPTKQFVEEALEDRAKRARQELRERRVVELDAPLAPIHEGRNETV